MAHAHTPYYVVETLIKILLEMEECRTAAEIEHAVREHITDQSLREDLCLLNDLLGIHVRQFLVFWSYGDKRTRGVIRNRTYALLRS